MMGAAAVAVVVVCAVMYTIFEVIERRKRKKFAEDMKEVEELTKGEFSQSMQEATGQTPIIYPASVPALILKAMTLFGYQILQYVDAGPKRMLLKYSAHGDLDDLAGNYGLTRRPAEKAKVTIRFTLADAKQPGAVGIPAQTRVRTQDGIYFATMDYAEITPGSQYVDVEAEAEEEGAASSGIEEGQINQLVDPIPYVASAVNVTASSGGTDIESDDSLTERTYLVPSTYSCAGPPDAYEYFAKAWRNDVKDVSVQSPSPCVVDIYFTLQDGTLPSKSDCDSMEENLRNDARRPMTDYVNCKAPTEVEYSIDVTYTIARSKSKIAVTVQNAVNEAVEVYKVWQRTMGRDIDPAELIAQIKNAGAKKVKITAPTDVVVGSAEIPKLTTCNVVYGGLEDD